MKSLPLYATDTAISGSPIPGADGNPPRAELSASQLAQGWIPGLPVVTQYRNELDALARYDLRTAQSRALGTVFEARDAAGTYSFSSSDAGPECGGTGRYGVEPICDTPDGLIALAGVNVPCLVPGHSSGGGTARNVTMGTNNGQAYASGVVAKSLADCTALIGLNAAGMFGIWQWSYASAVTAGFTGRQSLGSPPNAQSGAWLIPGRVVLESGNRMQKCLALLDGQNGFRRDTAADTWGGIGIPGATSWTWTNIANVVGANDNGNVWVLCQRFTNGTSIFWRSTDDGVTWTLNASFAPTDASNIQCALTYSAALGGFVYAMGAVVYTSPDGLTWTAVNTFANFKAHAFVGEILAGTITRAVNPYGASTEDTIAIVECCTSQKDCDRAPRSLGIWGKWVKASDGRIYVGASGRIRISETISAARPVPAFAALTP